jgi:hypothetical protein
MLVVRQQSPEKIEGKILTVAIAALSHGHALRAGNQFQLPYGEAGSPRYGRILSPRFGGRLWRF